MTRPRKASGAQIGARTKRVWVCAKCGLQHVEIKPERCLSCKTTDLLSFDSQGEANHWAELKLREKIGEIYELQHHVTFYLDACCWTVEDGVGCWRPQRVGAYEADFTFREGSPANRLTVQDYKAGAMTELAEWKLRHMAAQGMPVEIVGG